MMDEEEKAEDLRRLKKKLRLQPLRFVHIFIDMVLMAYAVAIFLATLTVKTNLLGYETYLHFYLGKPVLVIYVASLILMALASLGIVVSLLNIYQGITTFGVLLFGLFMFEITIGAVFLAISDSADRSITRILKTRMNDYIEYHTSIDYIQTSLGCCGVNNFTDWNSILGFIPGSCCNSNSACKFADVLKLNEPGCHSALKELINLFINNLIIIICVLLAIQLTSLVISLYLGRGLIDYHRRFLELTIDENNRSEELENPMVHNPLGLRNDNISLPGRSLNNQIIRPNFRIGENFVRNPIYTDTSFNNYPGQSTTPTAQSLPRAHRRFPIGNIESSRQ